MAIKITFKPNLTIILLQSIKPTDQSIFASHACNQKSKSPKKSCTNLKKYKHLKPTYKGKQPERQSRSFHLNWTNVSNL